MREMQTRATLSNHRPHTPNEQVSGSSPLVGSLFFAQEALDTFVIPSVIALEKAYALHNSVLREGTYISSLPHTLLRAFCLSILY
jgi:hypothetical protein